jgi:predicted acetyltransferase
LKIQELDKNQWKKEIRALYSECFNEGFQYENFYFSKVFKNIRCFGILDKEKLMSMAFVLDKVLSFDYKRVECPLIAGVCTTISHRKKGYAFNLIEYIKSALKDEGLFCIYLSPVNPDIYKKNEFVPFCFEEEFIIKYDGKGDLYLKQAFKNDISLLSDIYNKFSGDKNAFAFRDNNYFKLIIEASQILKPIYLIYKKSNCLGYIYYDGLYWDICVDKSILNSIKEMDKTKIMLPSKSQNKKVSQMLCILDEQKLIKICPTIKKSLNRADNFNFDKYQ